MVIKEDIIFGLSLLGIKAGDIVLVHSALSSIGYVDGGSDTVIDALLETVGKDGTIVMSSLTGWFHSYDAEKTPSEVGKISEVFRKRENAVRSLHPVHSITAIGKDAEYIASGHDKCETGCGKGTPYMKIHDIDGKILLLGVDMDRNTFMHTIEDESDAQYLVTIDIPAPTYIKNWQRSKFTLKKFPPGHRDFIGFTSILRKRDAIIEGIIGNAVSKVMNVKDIYSIGMELLTKEPLFFLCHNENCNFCNYARTKNDETDFSKYLHNRCSEENCEICVVASEQEAAYV